MYVITKIEVKMKLKNFKKNNQYNKFFLYLFVFSYITLNTYSQGFVTSVVSLTGSVVNEITKQPETVSITVFDDNGEKVTSTRSIGNEKGSYFLTGLKTGENYTVRLKKKDFLDEVWKFSVAKDGKYVEMSHDFLIKPKEVGVQIPLAVPPFEYSKSKLRFGSEFLLEDLKNTLMLNDNVSFQILCYPDNNDNPTENQKTTDERAAALQTYFVANGIASSRITVMGSKNTDPKNPPPTGKSAKGKRYIGASYIKLTSI